jgi:hypothetical protein
MTAAEVSSRTNVHDGYVLRVLPQITAPVEQTPAIAASQSTLEYAVGYSSRLKQWIPLRDGRVAKGLTPIGVRATLRAVQAGGENWQLTMRAPGGRVKRFFPTAYQPRGPGGRVDCFADYLTQRQLCQGRTAQVLWFVDAACLLPGAWTFTLLDEPGGGDTGVAALTVTVPGKPKPNAADPCAVTPTPVTEHDQDPAERAFQRLAQRELAFSRAGAAYADPSLVVQLVSRGHMLLSDGAGRLTGFDGATGAMHEQIPESSYRDILIPPALAQDPQARPIRSLAVAHPRSTDYVLTVHGTEGEPYWMSIATVEEGRSITLVQTDPHVSSAVAYKIRLNLSDVHQLRVTGAFSGDDRVGGGASLLTFGSPTASRTELRRGTTETDLLIFYGQDIDTHSLRARLNGKDARARFHPYKGWREVVSLPLVPGDNRLDVVIKGRVNRTRRTEHVRLAFGVAR